MEYITHTVTKHDYMNGPATITYWTHTYTCAIAHERGPAVTCITRKEVL